MEQIIVSLGFTGCLVLCSSASTKQPDSDNHDTLPTLCSCNWWAALGSARGDPPPSSPEVSKATAQCKNYRKTIVWKVRAEKVLLVQVCPILFIFAFSLFCGFILLMHQASYKLDFYVHLCSHANLSLFIVITIFIVLVTSSFNFSMHWGTQKVPIFFTIPILLGEKHFFFFSCRVFDGGVLHLPPGIVWPDGSTLLFRQHHQHLILCVTG